MNSTGIVRNVDELGRIVIPIETRDRLYIKQGDSMEIFYDETTIYLKKYSPGCTFCDNMNDISPFKGLPVCSECRSKIKKMA